jgi:hypothetical protein
VRFQIGAATDWSPPCGVWQNMQISVVPEKTAPPAVLVVPKLCAVFTTLAEAKLLAAINVRPPANLAIEVIEVFIIVIL